MSRPEAINEEHSKNHRLKAWEIAMDFSKSLNKKQEQSASNINCIFDSSHIPYSGGGSIF